MGLDLSHFPKNPDFSTAKCPSCGALTNTPHFMLKILSKSSSYSIDEINEKLVCPICQYENAFLYCDNKIDDYTLENVYQIATGLSQLKDTCNPSIKNINKTPLVSLLELLTMSSKFIHICTYSFDIPMLFILKTVSIKIPVVLIFNEKVNNSWLLEEISRSNKEDKNLSIYQVPRDHQKLIVIDGLIAIKGSQNFTSRAWRNLEDNKEIADFESDVTKVRELNNSFFASTIKEWREINDKPYSPYPF
ncbi:phospholipase D-like domain-containing protein [Synechocystis salina]|uniref:PLD phosphodiesterase domain-containing protein n=1 Tax=Synechocystis salina LEGE 00031 TaxID=1828736 RepID=A0ABR9VZA8_9SYNC|nr:phospholipase D-like domain-containing protein [Synechocystis salina]MBE9242580.1 hypothetical protein [Synechocystis salina LEGE 00041]MBE9255561.1 hypothetical protein [Synechocystis salina LEGE 00031]